MKRPARIVGILFIIGTVAGVVSVLLTAPVLGQPDYLAVVAENEARLQAGALLIVVMGFCLAMIPVTLFPILREYGETLALGAVVFRGALEAAVYLAMAVSSLLLVDISRQYMSAASPTDADSFSALGDLVRNVQDTSNDILTLVFCVGAAMIYWLFYVSGLVPRWLSLWGLAGTVLYLAEPLLALFGFEQLDLLKAPLGVQEMVVAIWLIVKGFRLPSRQDPLAEKLHTSPL